mmetsp:Transcript_102018/g.327354  ORF Transcript_102018/g.327354 Transcript_102018/m.327354 type:complete len:84 (-) Transcript_102018:418-669(-)
MIPRPDGLPDSLNIEVAGAGLEPQRFEGTLLCTAGKISSNRLARGEANEATTRHDDEFDVSLTEDKLEVDVYPVDVLPWTRQG